jgi:D-glycero-alpha-D-manno-heptose-7-phosphate kinase
MSLVVTKTPYRISFFGGGTDYPDWYEKEGGQVLSTTIDKYCYVSCRFFPEFFPPQHRVVWSSIEVVASITDIRHPAVREALVMLGYDDTRGIEVNHHGDLPARSGMGSSSAFAAGLIRALAVLKGGDVDREALYRRAMELEQQRLAEHVGSQDQVAVSLGGFNRIRFAAGATIEVEPVELPEGRLDALKGHLMLFYLGRKRFASDIAGEVISNIGRCTSELHQIGAHVDSALAILRDGDILDFGRLLDETWQLKRRLGKSVSNETIDTLYARGRDSGALGGKLLGAGGTGFMLMFVLPERQDAVRDALKPHIHVDFDFERQGCHVFAKDGKP